MARIQNRSDLVRWIRRQLGEPVIEVNLDDTQIEDEIDKAYDFWSDYHYAASRREYLAIELTQQIIDNSEIPLPENVSGVSSVWNPSMYNSGTTSDILFSPEYNLRLQDVNQLADSNLTGYVIGRQHLALVNSILSNEQEFSFNKYEQKVILLGSKTSLAPGRFVIVECHIKISIDEFPKIYGDIVFRNLAAAYSRLAWGRALSKYDGVQLPGGVTISGQSIIAEADKDIQKYENEFILKYQAPDFPVLA